MTYKFKNAIITAEQKTRHRKDEEKRMISYEKLFKLLKAKGMKKNDLRTVISPNTVAKLSNNKNVNTEVIDKLCILLQCTPNDIMSTYTLEEVVNPTTGEKSMIEVPTNQPSIKLMNELLNSDMMNGVIELFKAQVNDDKAVESGVQFVKDIANGKAPKIDK